MQGWIGVCSWRGGNYQPRLRRDDMEPLVAMLRQLWDWTERENTSLSCFSAAAGGGRLQSSAHGKGNMCGAERGVLLEGR